MIPSVAVPVAEVCFSLAKLRSILVLYLGTSFVLSTLQSCSAAVLASVIVMIAFT